VIPALNEARNLPHVFASLPDGLHEVILVDGPSTDGTVAVARRLRPNVRVVNQTRRGKGNALACGFAVATGDVIVTLDADGSTDPGEIGQFIEALRTSGADFAKGTRFSGPGGSADITRIRRCGNKALNWVVNRLYRTEFTDLCYGYNAFWRSCLPAFRLAPGTHEPSGQDRSATAPARLGDGFEIETLLHLRAATAGLKVVEVPSFERKRLNGRSNLHAVQDGLRVLGTIGREKLAQRKAASRPGSPRAATDRRAVAPGGPRTNRTSDSLVS
jgi:glycosyltransferase involved in cell wall biosynthesis